MDEHNTQDSREILAGIDIGSTTTKLVVLDARTHELLHSEYRRHHAHQLESLHGALADLVGRFPNARVRLAMSGSGGHALADFLGVPYLQEVVANSVAVAELYPAARCAIELGGQDAKMIFFSADEAGALRVDDMRMNGSCAGGTGAFLDEIATLLKVPVEQMNALACAGETVYQISGRCGVFAKTDIQPLLNQGAAKPDIVLSTFHAVAKQTLGGLAQGLTVRPPVIFEGGPLTFNPRLIEVFKERLGLGPEDVVIPANPEVIVAMGAALSLQGMHADAPVVDPEALLDALDGAHEALAGQAGTGTPFFESAAQRHAFERRHALPPDPLGAAAFHAGDEVHAYLGIDSGSTTTKFALIDEDGQLIDRFYAPNKGEPLDIARDALADLGDRWRAAGIDLVIEGCGTTGYGEALFAAAFHADTHMVETVAHSVAAARIVPDATFVLDIGGQDMKAIWCDGGVVTDILVNEACSSGCGSFLENFASTLGIATGGIAAAAFRSKNPAVLGSRCTVFMNSSVVTEQKNGKSPDDIMAGLCRSIIENVFTKVIRVSNTSRLGDKVVVQGGTFANDAVLAAFEQYLGREVTRAPYPGLMGAIGAALLAQQEMARRRADDPACVSSFIGLAAARGLAYTQATGEICPFCSNACSRTVITFADGGTYVTGNRCERGEVVGDPHDADVRARVRQAAGALAAVPNLYELREELLFKDYACGKPKPRNLTIGLPRVLALWETAPFWTTFWRALGFKVRLSGMSTRASFERGLPAVASDTVCFPAKLVHGHVRELEEAKVDRIFMPVITTVPSENTEATSQSMCAVVKGYPMVMRNSDNPTERSGIPFDDPLFHWFSDADRERQLSRYLKDTYGIGREETRAAIAAGDAAMEAFHARLFEEGAKVLAKVRAEGSFAVVLAGRPYHSDPLVNHDLPELFCSLGVPVLTADSLADARQVDLSKSRLDIVNNYHARMISGAILAAASPELEYAQIVSFGCGHDAYLSDEIVRITHELSEKSPLVLKVDESDVPGPLRIRVRSFVETVRMRRSNNKALGSPKEVSGSAAGASSRPAANPTRTSVRRGGEHKGLMGVPDAAQASARPLFGRTAELPDPYPQKFSRADKAERVILVPNTSHAFSRLMAAVFSKQGVRAVPLPVGREEAIRLGKKYVHNDICFPAQIVIGEALAELETGKYDHAHVAVATGKYVGDCRLTHYAALLRRALDEAGYKDVPIVTNDDVDYHNMQPGWKMNAVSAARIAMCLPMIDCLEELLRKMRPYETVPGAADAAFERALDCLIEGLERGGTRGAHRAFRRSIQIMKDVPYDRSEPRPTVLIVGEYLLNFHPGANHEVERYLEDCGFEVIEAKMTDVIRKTYFYQDAQVREFGVSRPAGVRAFNSFANQLFERAHDACDSIAKDHPLYEPACRMPELVKASDGIIHHSFDAGEGVLIPGEILHHAAHGCRAFLILQPFGCLPNHIVGRGIAKRLKELYPDAQILPLDYDPDVSFANLENRLQMLVMNAQARR